MVSDREKCGTMAPALRCDSIWNVRGLYTTQGLVDIIHIRLLAAEEWNAHTWSFLDYREAFDHVDHTVLDTKCKLVTSPILSLDRYVHFVR